MNINVVETLFIAKEDNKLKAVFSGETFFAATKVVDLDQRNTYKWLLQSTAFNGFQLGYGLTSLLLTEGEIQQNFSVSTETFEQMEQRLINNSLDNEEDDDLEVPAIEELFTEEELEELMNAFKKQQSEQKYEPPKVELRLWQTELTPKVSSHFTKMGDVFVVTAFASTPNSDNLSYVLTKIEKIKQDGLPDAIATTDTSLMFKNVDAALKHFRIVE